MPQRIRFTSPDQGEIFALNNSDIYDTTMDQGFFGLIMSVKGPGRYVIYRADDGEIRHRWMLEDDVRQLFAEANVPLPPKVHSPETVWVKKARQTRMIFWIGSGALFIALYFGVKKMRRMQRVARGMPADEH